MRKLFAAIVGLYRRLWMIEPRRFKRGQIIQFEDWRDGIRVAKARYLVLGNTPSEKRYVLEGVGPGNKGRRERLRFRWVDKHAHLVRG